jgi:hypothetical protein
MNNNFIHFRLKDDQTCNMMLDSHPGIAFLASVDPPSLAAYFVSALRYLITSTKSKGIRIAHT